ARPTWKGREGPPMRKLFLSAVLAVGTCGLAAAPSPAGTFGLFTCGNCCCKNCCTFCVRQYNAFSPTASGSICLEGCAPFCGNGGAAALNYSGIPCGPLAWTACGVDGAVAAPDSLVGQLLPGDGCCGSTAGPP